MESSTPAAVLVVANRTAATGALLDAVRARVAEGPATFTLLVPRSPHGLHRVMDPEDESDDEALQTLALAVPLIQEAAGGPVEGKVGAPEPLAAIEDAVNTGEYTEIILSTLPTTVSRWLKLDLPSKVSGLGLPLTTITAKG